MTRDFYIDIRFTPADRRELDDNVPLDIVAQDALKRTGIAGILGLHRCSFSIQHTDGPVRLRVHLQNPLEPLPQPGAHLGDVLVGV